MAVEKENPAKLLIFVLAPRRLMQSAGMFTKDERTPAVAISLAATALPTTAERLGAINPIRLSTKSTTFFFAESIERALSHASNVLWQWLATGSRCGNRDNHDNS